MRAAKGCTRHQMLVGVLGVGISLRPIIDRWQRWRGYSWRVHLAYREGTAIVYLHSIEPDSIALASMDRRPNWTLIGWSAVSI